MNVLAGWFPLAWPTFHVDLVLIFWSFALNPRMSNLHCTFRIRHTIEYPVNLHIYVCYVCTDSCRVAAGRQFLIKMKSSDYFNNDLFWIGQHGRRFVDLITLRWQGFSYSSFPNHLTILFICNLKRWNCQKFELSGFALGQQNDETTSFDESIHLF